MYSKKVMDYFRGPKNVGKIENADGTGKVGNVVCLHPQEKVHIIKGIEAIGSIKEGDLVLSHNGVYNRVERSVSRIYKGKIIELKHKLGKIKLTPEHLVLAIKLPKGNKFLRTKYKKTLFPAWYHSAHLKKGDILLYPIQKDTKIKDYLVVDIPKEKYDFKSKAIPKKIPLNANILRLFGYFLAEGHISEGRCNNYITFTLNITENDIITDIEKTANSLGIGVTIRKLPKRKTAVVYIYSSILARFFKKLFGKYAYGKKIPDTIMSLPPELQKHLIYGMWKGDGYINLERVGARAGYSTISYDIVQQMKVLLLRQGIIPSLYREKESVIDGVHHKENYRIHIGQKESLKKLCKIMGVPFRAITHTKESSWMDNKYLYTPIRDITAYDYDGVVCNLEVERSHSFTTESFSVHNCGDKMHLYIKVSSKGNKEIISDIKFETYGCAAAIATSSMVTEMAKGKTIAEALKITKNDVARELGGLPPIKLHCSVLAVDALQEAVYDYLTKNRKTVPDSLKKEHERIRKEYENVCQRHGSE